MDNTTLIANSSDSLYQVPEWFRICYTTYLFFIIGVGVPGNILVAIVYGKSTPKTACDWLIFAMGITDAVVCFVTPVLYIRAEFNIKVPWMNRILCSLEHWLQSTALIASCVILVVIAMDRYVKICKPTLPSLSPVKARNVSILCILISSVVSGIPIANFDTSLCLLVELRFTSLWIVYYLLMFCAFLISFVLVTFAYYNVCKQIIKKIKIKQRLMENDGLHSSVKGQPSSQSESKGDQCKQAQDLQKPHNNELNDTGQTKAAASFAMAQTNGGALPKHETDVYNTNELKISNSLIKSTKDTVAEESKALLSENGTANYPPLTTGSDTARDSTDDTSRFSETNVNSNQMTDSNRSSQDVSTVNTSDDAGQCDTIELQKIPSTDNSLPGNKPVVTNKEKLIPNGYSDHWTYEKEGCGDGNSINQSRFSSCSLSHSYSPLLSIQHSEASHISPGNGNGTNVKSISLQSNKLENFVDLNNKDGSLPARQRSVSLRNSKTSSKSSPAKIPSLHANVFKKKDEGFNPPSVSDSTEELRGIFCRSSAGVFQSDFVIPSGRPVGQPLLTKWNKCDGNSGQMRRVYSNPEIFWCLNDTSSKRKTVPNSGTSRKSDMLNLCDGNPGKVHTSDSKHLESVKNNQTIFYLPNGEDNNPEPETLTSDLFLKDRPYRGSLKDYDHKTFNVQKNDKIIVCFRKGQKYFVVNQKASVCDSHFQDMRQRSFKHCYSLEGLPTMSTRTHCTCTNVTLDPHQPNGQLPNHSKHSELPHRLHKPSRKNGRNLKKCINVTKSAATIDASNTDIPFIDDLEPNGLNKSSQDVKELTTLAPPSVQPRSAIRSTGSVSSRESSKTPTFADPPHRFPTEVESCLDDDDEIFSDEPTEVFFAKWKRLRAKAGSRHSKNSRSSVKSNGSRKRFARERQMTLMLLSVTTAFLLSWIPPWVVYLINLAHEMMGRRDDRDYRESPHNILRNYLIAIHLVNFVASPIIYYIFNPTFRSKVKSLFPVRCKRCVGGEVKE